MQGVEPAPVQKKAWSRAPSIDHYRSVSICSIPVPNETPSPDVDEEFNLQQTKNIERILNETDEEFSMNESFTKIPSRSDPMHCKAYSEDLAKCSGDDVGVREAAQVRVDLASNDISIFFPPSRNLDETKVVTDLLNLQLEGEPSSGNTH